MSMLIRRDLQKIGEVMDEKIQAHNVVFGESLGKMLEEKMDEKIEWVLQAVKEGFEATATKDDLAVMKHELMDDTDRTFQKTAGNLRSELRERHLIA